MVRILSHCSHRADFLEEGNVGDEYNYVIDYQRFFSEILKGDTPRGIANLISQ